MNSLAKSLLIKFRIQRSALAFQAAACVAMVCYWAALVDGVNALGTAVFVFVVAFVMSWRLARPFGDIAAGIDKVSDPQAIARTCLSGSVPDSIKAALSDEADVKIKFQPVRQLTGMVLLSVVFALLLQWQSYSPQQLNVSQRALLDSDLSKIGADGGPQKEEQSDPNAQKLQTNEKRAKQLATDARQYGNLNVQAPSVNTLVGSVGYGDELFVLQRYQELLKK
ncbi:MAG: hypothetical protein ACKVJZ_00180 [Planctomycetota bacterium]